MADIRVGTCGFRLRQRAYYESFGVIELQKPFYQPPQRTTAERWREEAPEGFEFTLKAFQAITHPPNSPTFRRSKLTAAQRAGCGFFADTETVREAWWMTLEIARAVDATFVVFQCPAAFKPTEEHIANLRSFFGWADRGGMKVGWEPRGKAWTDALVRDLCRELSLTHVVDPFERKAVYGTPRYYRMHGIGGYRYKYTDDDLERLHGWCGRGTTYCMFNNDAMNDDARRFLQLVGTTPRSSRR